MHSALSYFRILVLIAVIFSAAGCGRGGSQAPPTTEEDSSDGSLPIIATVPEFSLVNQEGQPFGSSDLDGKLWIATVVFTRSGSNTPQQMSMMEQLRNQLEAESLWPSVRLITVTAEPEHDTAEILKRFASEHSADSARWTFLTGNRDDVADLIEGLGLPLLDNARTSSRPLTLSPKFVVVDRRQRVRGIYDVFTSTQLHAMMSDLGIVLPEAPHLDGGGQTNLVIPPENLNLEWVEDRRDAQLTTAAGIDVYHDFSYTDRRDESGITFRNKIVDHAGKEWMPNHYDHGNGIAIADVDGDGLLDVYFTTQVGENELWRNTGGGRFENITGRAGIALADRISVAASFADIDNDGNPDLYVTTVKGGNALFQNDGTGTFTDITAGSGVGYNGHSSSAVFFDFDRDGLLDLFLVNVGVYTSETLLPVTNGTSPEQSDGRIFFYAGREDAFAAHLQPDRSERSIIYRNLGAGRFEDVTEQTGLVDESWSGDASPIDANHDGWTDLYVLNMQGDDQFYENVGGERFVRKSRALFPRTPWGSMGIKSFDFDNDADLDLFLTDMHSDMSEAVGVDREKAKSDMQWPDSLLADGKASVFGNAFYRREGDGRYIEVSDQIGVENYWPWGISVGDLNADGFDDVFVASSMNFPFRYGVNKVLLNERGERFVDSEYILGVEPRRDTKTLTPWFTLECAGADRAHEYCLGRSGEVVVWGAVGSRSSAVFDLDGDGDLDIITNDFNSEPLVLVSDLTDRKDDIRFLKVRLVGTESNADGLGAHVTVHAGGQSYTKVLDGATGYLSHGVYPLYFGLGGAMSVDRVEIQWPSGNIQSVQGPIDSNLVLRVVEE